MSHDAGRPVTSTPQYAQFSRRLRAIVIDWMISLAVIFGAVLIAVNVGNDNFSRALGVLVVTVLLLYEPLLVSFSGGTLGHRFTNLRVVDDNGGKAGGLFRRNGDVCRIDILGAKIVEGLFTEGVAANFADHRHSAAKARSSHGLIRPFSPKTELARCSD